MGDGLWLMEIERVVGFLDEYNVFMDMIQWIRRDIELYSPIVRSTLPDADAKYKFVINIR